MLIRTKDPTLTLAKALLVAIEEKKLRRKEKLILVVVK